MNSQSPASMAETPSLSILAGPQLVGLVLNWVFQGVLTVQCTYYHSWFACDHFALKSLVYGILIYEWVQTGLITAVSFDHFVYNYGSIKALTGFANSWFSVTVMSAVVASVVQCFFAWRIYIIGRSKLLTVIVVSIALCQMAIGVAGGVMLKVIDPSATEVSAVSPVISSWFAAAAAVDIIIAVSMSVLLLRAKNELGKSNDLINKLVRLGIETGTVTAAVAILSLIFYTALSDTLLHECTTLVLPKLYSNSLLVSLNNRVFMRRGKDSDTAMADSYLLTTFSPATGSMQKQKSGEPPRHVSNPRDGGGLEVHVHEVTFSDYDEVHLGKSLPSNGDSLQDALV